MMHWQKHINHLYVFLTHLLGFCAVNSSTLPDTILNSDLKKGKEALIESQDVGVQAKKWLK